jgi:hypothetical protein
VVRYIGHQTGITRLRNEIAAPYAINAQGWNTGAGDYTESRTPGFGRVAVVGDSYVEAFSVAYTNSIGERLAQELAAAGRPAEVYRFDISGAPLSQYLYMIEREVVLYRPDWIVVVLVHNDFDESFRFVQGRYTSSFLKLHVENGRVIDEIAPLATSFAGTSLGSNTKRKTMNSQISKNAMRLPRTRLQLTIRFLAYRMDQNGMIWKYLSQSHGRYSAQLSACRSTSLPRWAAAAAAAAIGQIRAGGAVMEILTAIYETDLGFSHWKAQPASSAGCAGAIYRKKVNWMTHPMEESPLFMAVSNALGAEPAGLKCEISAYSLNPSTRTNSLVRDARNPARQGPEDHPAAFAVAPR